MTIQQTFVIFKPDVAGLPHICASIINDIAGHGMDLVYLDRMRPEAEIWEQHYGEHVGKSFFPDLMAHMQSGPVKIGLVEGENAIDQMRTLIGATDPSKADDGTIRARLYRQGISAGGPANSMHSSDSAESVDREVELWLPYLFLQIRRARETAAAN